MTTVLYNEIEPFAVKWLKNLMLAGEIPLGEVDDRSIKSLKEEDFSKVKQFHTFAGIGGWPLALKWAGWPEDREVWTGSCPCQPFSVAGKRAGESDARHLWPDFCRLIAKLRPATIFGEQVASADGRLWLAGVRSDLEGLGYAVGAADLCAAGVGAPQIRQRLYWVADSKCHRSQEREKGLIKNQFNGGGGLDGISNSEFSGLSRKPRRGTRGVDEDYDAVNGSWDKAEFRIGADGKTRRIEPGISPLAHGVPNRMGKLRAYGNAIVPQLAAEFIGAFLDTEEGS